MKYFLLLLVVIVSNVACALPCPNGQGILYKGDAIEEVIRQCGQPTTKNTYTRTTYSLQELIYYRGHVYDHGFSQIDIMVQNGRVSSIRINDRYWLPVCLQGFVQVGTVMTLQRSCGDWAYYTYSTNLCGYAFSVGDSLNTVLSICGTPAAQSDLQTYREEVTELTYGGNNPQTIVFLNGRLLEWRN